jgi:hypothetical protein
MRLSIVAALLTGIVIGGLTWGAARGQSQSGEGGGGAAGWRARHVTLDGKPEFEPVVRGRALIHSIIHSSSQRISTVSFVVTTDPRDDEATITSIHAPTTSGTGQIELDVEAPDGLWIRGDGVVTVLYRPL